MIGDFFPAKATAAWEFNLCKSTKKHLFEKTICYSGFFRIHELTLLSPTGCLKLMARTGRSFYLWLNCRVFSGFSDHDVSAGSIRTQKHHLRKDNMEAMVATLVDDGQLAKSSTQVVFHVLLSLSKFIHNVGLQSISKKSSVSAKVQELRARAPISTRD